jgi:RNA recognition motif-containing protein
MTQVFVGNLTYSTTEFELRSMFEKHGRVSSVRLATEMGTGKPRGFAFVTMPRMEDAEEAIVRLNGAYLGGRALIVNEARSNDTHKKSAQSSNRSSATALLSLL